MAKYVCLTAHVGRYGGARRMFQAGAEADLKAADVKGREHFWAKVETPKKSTRKKKVETATAAPGESRDVEIPD